MIFLTIKKLVYICCKVDILQVYWKFLLSGTEDCEILLCGRD